ncbi:MAG: magnesium transporter [Canibacter sp.]
MNEPAPLTGPIDWSKLDKAAERLHNMDLHEIADHLERSTLADAAVQFRLLSKDQAAQVFDDLDSAIQADLISALRADEVQELFSSLDPDDRARLVDEIPAQVAARLIEGLDATERAHTTAILGYPTGTVGRRMSPHYVNVHPDMNAADAFTWVKQRAANAETIYSIIVTGPGRVVEGIVSLRELLVADEHTPVRDLMSDAETVEATRDEEDAARRLLDRDYLLIPVVDLENRLLGILTVDDAVEIQQLEEDEDAARAGGAEPLRRPYLSSSVFGIARSRVVWLLVLGVSALLTVQVLELFEATLEQAVVLAMFIPLLTGMGGNTGTQAASTLTRALAVGDVRTRDILPVMFRELRVGFSLGLLMGSLGLGVASLVYNVPTGIVIGLTIVAVCSMSATVGGAMPLIAKALKVDPAVFSTPFISTFCDAAGLLIYFSIAKAVLGI